MRALSYIGAKKTTFPPKPDRQTYIQTDGHQRLQSSFATKNTEKQTDYARRELSLALNNASSIKTVPKVNYKTFVTHQKQADAGQN